MCPHIVPPGESATLPALQQKKIKIYVAIQKNISQKKYKGALPMLLAVAANTGVSDWRVRQQACVSLSGPEFTSFTGTKGAHLTCFTGTNVQIVTLCLGPSAPPPPELPLPLHAYLLALLQVNMLYWHKSTKTDVRLGVSAPPRAAPAEPAAACIFSVLAFTGTKVLLVQKYHH